VSRSRARRLLWSVLPLLVLVGVFAAAARAVLVADLGQRMEPVRNALLAALEITDPHAAARPAEAARFDGSFAAHPVLARLHVVLGAVFLLLAPLQFAARVRARHLTLHRWSGRALLVAALVSTVSSLYFGLVIPFAGPAESVAIALFAALFLFALGRAYHAIRRRDVARHREWMIRAFAVAIGISTVRLVSLPLDPVLTAAGFTAAGVFLVSIWTGWLLTVAVAEAWIRHTRTAPPPVRAAAAAA
jgi:uncharacterized membrane protein